MREGELKESTLDYIFANHEIIEIWKEEKTSSDHLPITALIKIKTQKMSKKKSLRVITKKLPEKNTIEAIMKKEEWPTISNSKETKKLCTQARIIRPTIKMQNQANILMDTKKEWSDIEIGLKELKNDSFRLYVKDLDMVRQTHVSKFYKIINSLVKYKENLKMVKGIREGDAIYFGEKMNNKIKDYYQQIYHDEAKTNNHKHWNPRQEKRPDIEKAIKRIASNKANGLDNIPGEIYKYRETREQMISKLMPHFIRYMEESRVPQYFMEGKLVLISKDSTEYP